MDFNREPAVIIGGLGELVRQIVPFLVLFGFVTWNDKQTAGIFMLTSGILAFASILFTRSQVTPVSTANEQIQVGINSPLDTKVSEVIRAQQEGENVVQ